MRVGLATGVLAAVLFVWIGAIGIEAQGLYPDETFQATGAFAYKGKPPVAVLTFWRLPLMNTSYIGALKTTLYGLYLLAGGTFTVASWRIVGLLLVAAGMVGFAWLARGALRWWAMALFLLLVATDTTVVLSSRFDYGPTALSLGLRLLLIGAVLAPVSRTNSALVGFLLGIGVFEKLSNAALLPVLGAVFVLQRERRNWEQGKAFAAGFGVGLLPLAFVNALSLWRLGHLISLEPAGGPHQASWAEFIREFRMRYFDISTGWYLREYALGQAASQIVKDREFWVLGGLLGLAGAIGVAAARRAAGMIAAFFAVGLFVYLLPKVTSFHHQILVTPFPYAAIALALDARGLRWARAGLGVAATVYLGLHLGLLASVVDDFRAGRHGAMVPPGFTEIGHYAAERKNDAVFFHAAWGMWGQIYCLSGGEETFQPQLFWNYHGPEDLQRAIARLGRKTVYVLTPVRPFGMAEHLPATLRIEADMAALPGWREIPADGVPLVVSESIRVRKFVAD